MAAHRPNPNLTEQIKSTISSLLLAQEYGQEGRVSQYGIAYRTLRAVSKDQDALCAWVRDSLANAKNAGATTIVWRSDPMGTDFENARRWQKGVVMRLHVLPAEANSVLPPDTEGGPSTQIGDLPA